MGIFNFLFEETNNKKKDDTSGLDKWQKEEVKKGNYNLFNFEEDEQEDDDYYYEDDN